MRTLLVSFVLLWTTTPLLAQQTDQKAASALPPGWQARLDQTDADPSEVEFRTMGDGFHATTGPAAIFYDPEHVASGEYTAHATLTQTTAPEHPEAYGLFVGGQDLDASNQSYVYFLVRQDGSFMVKHRAGEETHTLIDWTQHEAVNQADAEGKATNALAMEVRTDGVQFLVNGAEVASLDSAPMMNTDGVVGLRINHRLDVHIADFGVEPASAGSDDGERG